MAFDYWLFFRQAVDSIKDNEGVSKKRHLLHNFLM